MNIPNLLTLLRLCTAPLIVVLLTGESAKSSIPAAIIVFVFAGVLDKLDGVIARRWNQVTEFGSIADPIVDKIWLHSVNVALLSVAGIPLWVVLLFIARDFVVAELRGSARVALEQGMRAAQRLGKLKLRMQILYTLLCMLGLMRVDLPAIVQLALEPLQMVILVVAIYFTIASLIYYAKLYRTKPFLVK